MMLVVAAYVCRAASRKLTTKPVQIASLREMAHIPVVRLTVAAVPDRSVQMLVAEAAAAIVRRKLGREELGDVLCAFSDQPHHQILGRVRGPAAWQGCRAATHQ